MKSLKTILLVAVALIITVGSISFIESKKYTKERTEEYAIITVVEHGRKKFITTSIGDNPAAEKVWEKQKTEIEGDLSPIIKELNSLNEQGFELVNESTAFIVQGVGGATNGELTHTFMMKKKLK